MLKTKEISRMLEAMKKEPLPEDKIAPSSRRLYNTLQETGLLKANGNLTVDGLSVLNEYNIARKEYGSGKVEIIPRSAEDRSYTFGVWINPNAKKIVEVVKEKEVEKPAAAIESKISTASSQNQPLSMKEYLSVLVKNNYSTIITSVEDSQEKYGNVVKLITGLEYNRRMDERNRLDDIARDVGADVTASRPNLISDSEKKNIPERVLKRYFIKDSMGEQIATLLSERVVFKQKRKTAKLKDKPLVIEINPEYGDREKVKIILDSLVKNFKPS